MQGQLSAVQQDLSSKDDEVKRLSEAVAAHPGQMAHLQAELQAAEVEAARMSKVAADRSALAAQVERLQQVRRRGACCGEVLRSYACGTRNAVHCGCYAYYSTYCCLHPHL